MARITAVILLFVPGILSAIGIKLMRDAMFLDVSRFFFNETIQFIIGLLLFIGGLAFIGGFIYHRDKKKQLIKKRK